MSDLTQEVKEALTGGSVAVVGVNAVGTENIKENAVKTSKIADGSVTIEKLSESFKREVQDLVGGTYKKMYNTSKPPASTSERENYILINQPTLIAGDVYSLEFIPNETFTQDIIQLGTAGSSSAMVDNVGANVSFVKGTSYWVDDYVPSKDDLGYVRVLGNAMKIDKVNVYVYENSDGRIDAIEDDVTDIKKTLYGGEVKEFKQSAQRPEGTIEPPNYWRVADPYLSKGTRYALEFIPNETFTQDVIQLGPTALSAAMVDTIATDVKFQAGVSYWVEEYIPSAEELDYIRVLNNAFKLDKINIYTYEIDGGALANAGGDSESDYHLAHKINKNVKEFRELRNSIDGSLSSLVQVKKNEGITKNVSIPSVGKRDKYILRVGLHYGAEQFTPSAEEIFLDGQANADFSDVRFFDKDGNMLKASLGKAYNVDLLEDSNLDKMLKNTSNGKLIGYENARGIVISENSGVTWNAITGTHNVTTNASAVYKRTSMYPVFVDSGDNIYAYAGGILYKLLASDNYATKKQVLDFSWDNNGTTVYPDIQDHAMDESRNGQLLVGADYQTQYRSRIYRSTDGGETFTLSWSGQDGLHQHTHHIHADRFTNRVYAGIDDGGSTRIGARIIYTENGGDSWVDVTSRHEGIRGRDYYPTYFGRDYKLGGGESYYNGGGTVYRADANDRNFQVPVKGVAGVRQFVDFGSDDLVFAGVQQVTGNSVNQILASDTQGKTWDAIYSKQQTPSGSSGSGFRQGFHAFTPKGESEQIAVFTRDWGGVKSMRIYKGGNHYYREAYIELENLEDAPIELTVQTGYMMAYPYNVLNGREHYGLVYQVPLNEGVGSYVSDSLGNIVKIKGNDYEWEREEEPVRFGDYEEYGKPLEISSGLLLKKGTTINFGKIPNLDFSKGYTVSFWLNPKNNWFNPDEYSTQNSKVMELFSAGNVAFINKGHDFGYADNSIKEGDNLNTLGRSLENISINGYRFSDQYFFITITVDGEGKVHSYINGANARSIAPTLKHQAMTLTNLSDGDFIIGSDDMPNGGYLSDIKIYNRILEENEVLENYKGW